MYGQKRVTTLSVHTDGSNNTRSEMSLYLSVDLLMIVYSSFHVIFTGVVV